MEILRSLIFNIILILSIILMGVISLPLLMGPREGVAFLRDVWIKFVIGTLEIVVGLQYQVDGLQNLPAQNIIIAAKHQSAWETLALHLIFKDPAIILKRELLKLPILGWFIAKVGMVPIDRTGGGGALKAMIQSAKHWSDVGRPIIIFPQGTRVEIGEKVKYHPGVFAVYKALDLPVVPVALNSGLFWPKQSFKKKPGTIKLKIVEAIQPGLERKEFMQLLENKIEKTSESLLF